NRGRSTRHLLVISAPGSGQEVRHPTRFRATRVKDFAYSVSGTCSEANMTLLCEAAWRATSPQLSLVRYTDRIIDQS
ncbi:hypothetical protein, partial [Escherichia coli]|uniref:hypothetical protein n=1 Tax=Escherichia coli TaxID=562 RepID=UPI001CC70582